MVQMRGKHQGARPGVRLEADEQVAVIISLAPQAVLSADLFGRRPRPGLVIWRGRTVQQTPGEPAESLSVHAIGVAASSKPVHSIAERRNSGRTPWPASSQKEFRRGISKAKSLRSKLEPVRVGLSPLSGHQ